MRILVSGGTGALGSAVVAELQKTANTVRLLSRRAPPTDADPALEWAQGDVVSGEGLEAALAGVDTVVNCTGDPRNVYETDVVGVKRLAESAHQAGVRHFFHVSIVGIESIDYPYYRHKVSAESAVIESGTPYSILRLTQFHSLFAFMMTRAQHTPAGWVLPIAHDALFQLIDTRDAAAYLVPLLNEPTGRLPDVGGPEILSVGELAQTYFEAHGIDQPEMIDPEEGFFPPPVVEAFRQGSNTVPRNRTGRIRWADYVLEHVPPATDAAQ
ncbi:MAG: NAD(P)H-binding protein [bacterium]|nr:NAD(P)H-binding protein [bacterium]